MDGRRKTSAIEIRSPRSSENKESKTKSTFELPNYKDYNQHVDEIQVGGPTRRRSKSAPLSLEASCIATELRRASDSLQSEYEDKKKIKRMKRRSTVAAIKSKRQSWPVNFIAEESEEPVFAYSQSYPSRADVFGTSL